MPRPPKPPRLASLLFVLLGIMGLLSLAGGGRLLLESSDSVPGLDLVLEGAPTAAPEVTGWILLSIYGVGSVVALGGLVLARSWGWAVATISAGSHIAWQVAQASVLGLNPFQLVYGSLALAIALLALAPSVRKWVFAPRQLPEIT